MKDPSDRTKVVVRHLPPSISQAVLMDQIDGRFAGRYDWLCFRPGRLRFMQFILGIVPNNYLFDIYSSPDSVIPARESHRPKDQLLSRAYLNFKRPEDVIEFADFFGGHIFVNEKGAQFKAIVEYAPSQRVPRPWLKKDNREGTISKDHEYMKFLEFISKPVENLPSAEIQLERKEAEKSGITKETLIVTPLMDFVRRKRAAKGGPQRLLSGKVSRRAARVSSVNSNSSRRRSERRKVVTSNYVLMDSTKKGNAKDKPTYILMSRREEHQPSLDKIVSVASITEQEGSEDDCALGAIESAKSRLVLLKGKEKESFDVVKSPKRHPPTSTSSHNQASGRSIRSIPSKEGHINQSCKPASHSEQQMLAANVEKETRPALPPNASLNKKDYVPRSSSIAFVPDGDHKKYVEDNIAINSTHGSISNSEKYQRSRNRDQPDRGIWAPLHRSDRSQSCDDTPGSPGILGGRRINLSTMENGSHRQVGLRGSARSLKAVDSSVSLMEGKSSKRGFTERQVWVQKSGSAS